MALVLVESVVVRGAVLEVQVADGDVTLVAEALVERGIPMVFQSESDMPPALLRSCPDVPLEADFATLAP